MPLLRLGSRHLRPATWLTIGQELASQCALPHRPGPWTLRQFVVHQDFPLEARPTLRPVRARWPTSPIAIDDWNFATERARLERLAKYRHCHLARGGCDS
jgi:hypothetical protein